jgi:electron transfer flavoprotein alpha subunit
MDQTQMILVLVEAEGGQCAPMTLELFKAAEKLAQENRDVLCACLLGHETKALAEEIAYYVSRVFVVDHPLLSDFQPAFQAQALSGVCLTLKPHTLIMGQTYENLETAPQIALRLGADLITDCIYIEREASSGTLLATKPVYSGHAQAVFELDTIPQLILLRPGIYKPCAKGLSQGEIILFDCQIDPSLALTEKITIVPEEVVNLGQAEVIIAAGRGVKNIEGVGELRKLISPLEHFFERVDLGASRPLVDAGLLPRSRQVGQTGEKVAPRLYIAVGISGSIQHLSGMINSEKVVAINTDREAPIFGVADYGVVGPFEEIIPAVVQALKEIS